MKWILYALVALVAAVTASIATGGSQPITAKVLAVAGEKQPFSFQIPGASKSVIETITVAPGASFGWHYHGAPVAAFVTSGALTLYDASYPGCGGRRMSAGQAFFESKNHVHLARNDGSKPAVVYVVMLGLTAKAKPNVPAAKPAACSAQ
jgi:quercetin dioxygenase-like cupin family protein